MQNVLLYVIQEVDSLNRTLHKISVRNSLNLFTSTVFLTFILVDKPY
jgi:hypothetical protein